MSRRPDLALLAAVLVAMLLILAVREGVLPDSPSLTAVTPRPTATATASPTPGWWGEVSVATPVLPALPALPKPALDGPSGSSDGPVPFTVVDCPTDGVQITAIERSGVWWRISGTASIPHLWYWKAELSPVGGSHWVGLHKSEASVTAGHLLDFHTGTVNPGAYQMRIVAVDRTGNYPGPCVIAVEVGR
jgi:hypothetical protein